MALPLWAFVLFRAFPDHAPEAHFAADTDDSATADIHTRKNAHVGEKEPRTGL
jgi:hypothetical protein